jgi:hypothetical protein
MKNDDISRGDLVDLESRLRRSVLGDSAATGFAENRILARVQGYVGDNPRRTGSDWQRLLLTIGAVAVPAAAAAAIAAILILGHGPKATKVVQPAATPIPIASAEPSAIPTVAALQTVIIQVSTPPSLVGPQTIHWVTASGTELGAQLLPSNEAIVGAGGNHVLIYRADGHVLDLHLDGTTDDVGSGMPKSTAPGPASVPVRTLVSPDGTQWIWGQIVSQSGNSVTSTITLGGIGIGPRIVVQAVEDNHALEPYRWTLANPLISHGAIGVGGYILFNPTYGAVDLLDLVSGHQTAVETPPAEGVDLAANGAKAYIENPPNGATPSVTVNGPGLRGLSAALPAKGQAGSLMFDGGSNHLVFATSPGAGPPHEHFETDIIDLNSGARTKFGPADLRPAMWLPDGRLVEFRTSGDGDGVPGTYLVALDGSATKVSPYDTVVGFVERAVP